MTVADLKRAVMQTNSFKLDNGFMLDIVCNGEMNGLPHYEAWLYHKDEGVKMFMFGVGDTYENVLETAVRNVKRFEIFYKQDYMNC